MMAFARSMPNWVRPQNQVLPGISTCYRRKRRLRRRYSAQNVRDGTRVIKAVNPLGSPTLEAIRALPRVVPRRHFAPKQVMLFPTTAISYRHYQHLENELCRCLEEQNRGIEGDLRELRTVIRTLAGMADEASDMAAYRQNAAQVLALLVHMLNAILQMHTLTPIKSSSPEPRANAFNTHSCS